jgi:hypothetical protein
MCLSGLNFYVLFKTTKGIYSHIMWHQIIFEARMWNVSIHGQLIDDVFKLSQALWTKAWS